MMTLAEGNGMGSSCKYSHLSGACANKHVNSLQCVGEDKCQFSGLNVITSKRSEPGADPRGLHARWLGLYCEEHRKFHCDCGEDPFARSGRAFSGLRTRSRTTEQDP